MALTQTSAGGLKISNAGTNGQYLQKQSGNTGGLTWADVTSVGGATGVDFNDNVKIRLGTGNDLELYHDGTSSIIENATGNLAIRGKTGENHIVMIPDSKTALYYDNAKKFETTSTGIEVRGAEGGNLEIGMYADEGDDNTDLWKFLAAEGTSSFYLQNKNSGSWETSILAKGDAEVQLNYDNALKFHTRSDGTQTTGIAYADAFHVNDDEHITLGDGNDLDIFHDGDNSYLQDNGTGFLGIQGSEVRIRNNSGHPQIVCSDDVVELWYDNAKKFETASSGCIVSGDSLKLPDGSAGTPSLTWTDEGNLDTGIFRPGANIIGFSTAGTQRVRIDNDGIKFGSDTAAANGLSDYEEGTWTPNVEGYNSAGSTTYNSNRLGQYVKIGRQVTAWFYVGWTAADGSGSLAITLPFTCSDTSAHQVAGSVFFDSIDTDGAAVNHVLHTWHNVNKTLIYYTLDNGGWSGVGIDSSGSVIGTITYLVA